MENGRYFTEDQCRFCESAYYLYRASYDRLASMALANGIPRWKVRPKQHMLEHEVIDFIAEYRLNPRYAANYMGEDAVRRIKQLAVASHPNHVSRHVLLKWSLQFSLPYRSAEGKKVDLRFSSPQQTRRTSNKTSNLDSPDMIHILGRSELYIYIYIHNVENRYSGRTKRRFRPETKTKHPRPTPGLAITKTEHR